MIDGRSVAIRTTSGNWLGVKPIPLESVAQIAFIRGSASALYGADAFLGVVNIITLKPEDVRPLSSRVFLGRSGGNWGGIQPNCQERSQLYQFELGVAG